MRRLMQTMRPLPTSAEWRFSQWSTMSWRNLGNALLGPDDRFDPSPSGLEALPGVRLGQLRDLVELLVESRRGLRPAARPEPGGLRRRP